MGTGGGVGAGTYSTYVERAATTQDTQIKSQWFSMFQPQARKLTKTSFRCIFCCHTKVFGVSLACVSMKAPIGKKYSVLAVCTLRAPFLSAAFFSLAATTSLQRPAREKSLAAGTTGSPRRRRPARRRQRARRQPPRCTRCAALRSLSLCTSCKQLQHFHVGQPPSSSGCAHGLCTWGCAWGASRVGLVAILCDFFCVANATRARHGHAC